MKRLIALLVMICCLFFLPAKKSFAGELDKNGDIFQVTGMIGVGKDRIYTGASLLPNEMILTGAYAGVQAGTRYRWITLGFIYEGTHAWATINKYEGYLGLAVGPRWLKLNPEARFGRFDVSGQYAFDERFDIEGWVYGLGLSMDAYLTKWLSLGLGGEVGFTYSDSWGGRSVGTYFNIPARLGFHL